MKVKNEAFVEPGESVVSSYFLVQNGNSVCVGGGDISKSPSAEMLCCGGYARECHGTIVTEQLPCAQASPLIVSFGPWSNLVLQVGGGLAHAYSSLQ